MIDKYINPLTTITDQNEHVQSQRKVMSMQLNVQNTNYLYLTNKGSAQQSLQ